MTPLVDLIKISIPEPSDEDKRADEQRIGDALGLDRLEFPLYVLNKIPFHRSSNLTCVVGNKGGMHKLIDIGAVSSYSIALDIGTTNMVASLYDNDSNEIVITLKKENPQILYGSDILTRLHHAMAGRADELCRIIIDGVNSLIREIADSVGINSHDIHAITVAGNTVMCHFFLGLDISRIPVAPYVPVVRRPGFLRAADLGLCIHEEALAYVFPNAGSYVGGDIVSGIMASGICDSEDVCVLIDVGTNAEVVIGNRDWMLVGAGAAGPALEEGIAGIGRRAEKGIVYDLEISNGGAVCRTFDNAPAEGICGSGMVSLIHEMYQAGILSNDGMLNPGHADVQDSEGTMFYSLLCGGADALVIKQTEVDNFLRSKAAMFTLLLVMLRSVGLQFGDVKKVYVAGALGNGIDAGKAAAIGMLPAWPADRITPVGNASLSGAEMVLKDCDLLDREEEIINSITYKHMHDDPEFMKEFRGAIFIPHTDPGLLQVR